MILLLAGEKYDDMMTQCRPIQDGRTGGRTVLSYKMRNLIRV